MNKPTAITKIDFESGFELECKIAIENGHILADFAEEKGELDGVKVKCRRCIREGCDAWVEIHFSTGEVRRLGAKGKPLGVYASPSAAYECGIQLGSLTRVSANTGLWH